MAAQEETNDSEEVEQKCSLKAKILSSLKTELAKMELAEKNRADLTKTVQGTEMLTRSRANTAHLEARSRKRLLDIKNFL